MGQKNLLIQVSFLFEEIISAYACFSKHAKQNEKQTVDTYVLPSLLKHFIQSSLQTTTLVRNSG